MRGLTGEELLPRPVRLHGIQLGRPVDLLLLGPGWRLMELVLEDGERVPLDGLVMPGLRSR